MLKTGRLTLCWLIANYAGIALYIYFASQTWVTPLDGVLAHAAGDPIVYILSAFPILGMFALGNLAWLVMILRKKRGRSGLIGLWILIAASWIAANQVDAFYQ